MGNAKRKLSAKQVFDEIAYSPLDWPGKTVRLDRDSLQDCLQRPASGRISIAELYHENSKLSPAVGASLLAWRADLEQLRREGVARSACNGRSAGDAVPDVLRTLLRGVKIGAGLDLFYAVEVRSLVDQCLFVYEPLSEGFPLVKRLSAEDLATLGAALGKEIRPSETILFVLGRFARNDLLLGARGYRRTLLEAGRLLQEALRSASEQGLGARSFTEFTDADVDEVVETDGVEEGALAVIELDTIPDVKQ